MQILKKLTTKDLIVTGVKDLKTRVAKGPIFLGRVGGTATGLKHGTTQYGEWTALVGAFGGIDENGEEYKAPVLILPSDYHQFIAAEMGEIVRQGDASMCERAVSFMFDIHAKSSTGERGYTFYLLTVGDTCDPFAEQMRLAGPLPNNRQLAIAAPAAQETLPAESAPEIEVTPKGKKSGKMAAANDNT